MGAVIGGQVWGNKVHVAAMVYVRSSATEHEAGRCPHVHMPLWHSAALVSAALH